MPDEPILKERWRGEGLLEWLKTDPLLLDLHALPVFIQDELDAMKTAKTYEDYVFEIGSVLVERFLVLKFVLYREDAGEGERTIDDADWECSRTLEEARGAIEEHIFANVDDGYENRCLVFDTDNRTEVKWHEVRHIAWGENA